MERLKEKGIGRVKDVFFAALDSSGGLYISKGLESRGKEGEHGIEQIFYLYNDQI